LTKKISWESNKSSFVIQLIDKKRKYLKVSGPNPGARRKIFKQDHAPSYQGDDRWKINSNALTAEAYKPLGKGTEHWQREK
jgi:hypothetical protein